MEKCFELIDLIKEIDVIEAEMCDLHKENVKHEIENALTNLQKLQITSEEIKELLKYIHNVFKFTHNLQLMLENNYNLLIKFLISVSLNLQNPHANLQQYQCP